MDAIAMSRDRLFANLLINPGDPSGCVLWTGPRNASGYGKASIGENRSMLAHRAMWLLFEGPIPDGMILDHVRSRGCVNRHCASIAHLEVVTRRENTIRGDGPTSVNAAKTHCDSGHEFTPGNTYLRPNGNRDCRACIRARVARYKTRRAA